MKSFTLLAAAALLALAGCATAIDDAALSAAASAQIAASVAAPSRKAEHRALDEGRKPAEVLGFLGVRPGMAAADIFTGSGYWAEIMARAVAPGGSVVAFEPTQFYNGKGKVEIDALAAALPSTRVQAFPFERFSAPPNSFDMAMISLNYHDLYWEAERFKVGRSDPDAFLRNLYAAMRPGGVVGVIDHVGPAGDTRAIVEKTHRIDPATVRADFARAGFRLEAESPILANPADDYSKSVFDPAIRGKSDRLLFKFRKPGR